MNKDLVIDYRNRIMKRERILVDYVLKDVASLQKDIRKVFNVKVLLFIAKTIDEKEGNEQDHFLLLVLGNTVNNVNDNIIDVKNDKVLDIGIEIVENTSIIKPKNIVLPVIKMIPVENYEVVKLIVLNFEKKVLKIKVELIQGNFKRVVI